MTGNPKANSADAVFSLPMHRYPGAPDARSIFARGGVVVSRAPDARSIFARGGVVVPDAPILCNEKILYAEPAVSTR